LTKWPNHHYGWGTPNGRRSSEIGISHMHAPRLSCLLSDAFNSPNDLPRLDLPCQSFVVSSGQAFHSRIHRTRYMYFTRLGLQQRGGILTGETTVRVRSKNPASRLNMKACEGPANVGLLSIASSRLFGLEGPKKRKADGARWGRTMTCKGKIS